MCEWFDETCGELLDHLERRGLTGNTIVVYICDNGWAARSTNADDPNQKDWGAFALRSKGSPFENGIRTPIMIRWPGKVEPADAPELAQSIDLFPTVVRACGITPPSGLPGIDLLDAEARPKRTAIFGSTHAIHNMTVGDPDETLQYDWCIEGDWKLILRRDGKDTTSYASLHRWDREPVRLYRDSDDPHERTNLAEDHPDVVDRLRARITAWRASTAE